MSRTASRSAGSPGGSPSRACRPGPARRAGTPRRSGGSSATRPTPARPPTARRTRPAQPVRATRHARQRGQRSARVAREDVSPEEWKPIAVPALVTAEQFALVQQLLARNSRFSPRNTRRPSLLQGILVCRECGYAYYRCSTRSKNGILREYYRCSGTDGHRRPEGRVCANRPVRLAEIDELVWTRVLGLLDDPTLIQAEIDRRLQTLRAAHPATTRRDALQRDLTRAQNALRRLLDGYQEQLVTLDELRARTPELRKREATLQAQLDALDAELHDAETYLKLTETLDGFRARLSTSAENLTIEQRQQIIRLVVREVLIGEDDVTIRHSIPVPTRDQPPGYLLRSGSREEPDPGAGPHPAVAADQTRAGGDDDPRLQAPRHHDPVRGAGRPDRLGDRPVPAPPPPRRVPEVPADDRSRGPQTSASPSDPRQLRHPQPPQRQGMAGQAPTVRAALHPDLEQLAEHGRDLLLTAQRQSDPPRDLPQRPRPDRRDRDLPRRAQPGPTPIHLDRNNRADTRQGSPRTSHPRCNHQLKPRQSTSCVSADCAPSPGGTGPACRHQRVRS